MTRVIWVFTVLTGLVLSASAQMTAHAESAPAKSEVATQAVPPSANMVFSGDPQEVPIMTLQGFNAGWDEGRVHLEWTTATEFQNERLYLERSEDNSVYTIISEFEGHGTTTSPVSYQFTDGMVQAGKVYYYRLISQNSAGEISVHETVSSSPTLAQPVR